MNELILYNKYGAVLFSIDPEESSSHDWSLMSENKLSVSFEREECTVLAPGCYVEFDGIRFYLLDEYKPRMINSVTWKYDVAFLDAASWMSVVLAMNTIDGKNLPIFNYTGPAREHAEIIVANLNRYMGITEWKVGAVLATPNIAIEYRGKYCSQILQELVDVQNTEWWVDGMTLNIGRAEFGDAVELGYRNGLLGDISREQAAGQRAYAYLVPIGSTRNIDPTKYGYDRLQLPDEKVFIDINPDGVGELVEERAFAEIYPRYEGTVQYVRSRPAIGNDGNEFTIYYIGDMLPFNPNDYEIAGLVKRITFQSGELMGESFEVNYDADAQEFEIITQFPDGGQSPGGIFTPSVGDKYVIWNITMPDEYYPLASQEYLEAAEAFAESSVQDSSVYKGSLDYIDIQERGISVRPGRRVRLLSDEYFSKGYYDSRITRMTRRLWYPNEINIDVSAVRVVGSIARLDSSIQKTETQLSRLSGAQPTIIKSGEITPANDKAVYSSAKSEEEFLNKRKGGNVIGRADFITPPGFPAGAEFNGAVIRFDTEKKCWIFPFNVLVEGGVAWNSSMDGFEPQTVTDAVNVDGVTIGRTTSGALTVLAGAGGGINEAQLADYLTNNNYAKKSDIPSLSGYATEAFVTSRGYITSAAIPTKVSTFDNDSGYITESALTPYATTEVVNSLLTEYLPKSATAADSAKLNGMTSGYQIGAACIPTIGGGGAMEVGYIIDFHRVDEPDNVDYSTRLRCEAAAGNLVLLPQKSGTLAITSDIPTKLSQFTDDVVNGNYLSTSGGTVNGNITATGNVSAQNVAANGGITAGTIISFVDTDASNKVVLQRNSSGDILFCGGFADRNVYIDGSILRVRTENTIFSGGISATGVTLRSGDKSAVISYNASKNAFVFPANAIFEGGVAWNSSMDGFEPQTVTDAVNVDGVTIGRTTSGALTVLAGAGGGINEAQLADYLTNNNYAKKSDIPSLSGYATEAFVTSRGYITSAAIPTKVSTFDNDSGYITGITSSMVTSALGYTPYNAANFTKANIKTTLGISGWALASVKPSYTWTEITSRPTNVSAFTNDSNYVVSTGPVSLTSTLTAASVICATGKLRVNASDSVNNFGYIKAITYNSNRGLVHIGSNYGGRSDITNDGADVDAIGIYRGYVGIGRTFTGDELYANQSSGIALQVAGHLKVDGANLSLGGKTITYDATKNAFIFPANILAEGGVAWNSPMDGTSAYASEFERRIEALQTEVDTLKQTVQTLTA